MVEVEPLRPLWIGGEVRPAGTVAAMPAADAVYLAGLGRVSIIEPPAAPVVPPEVPPAATADDLIGEAPAAKGKKGG